MEMTPKRFMLAMAIWMSPDTTLAQVTETFTEPLSRVEVSAAEIGIVESVETKVGRRVRQGDLLGHLNRDVLQESLRLAELQSRSTGRIQAARAELRLRKTMFEKLVPLLSSGHANPHEVETAEMEYQRAQATLQTAEDELDQTKVDVARIRAQLRQREIRSPIDGIVIEVHRQPGEYLPANDPRFATIVDVSTLRARFFLTPDAVREMRHGTTISLTLGDRGALVTGTIDFVSPITEPDSGTVRVDVLIPNEQGKWRSGVVCRFPGQGQAKLSTFRGETPGVNLRAARLLP